MQDQALSLDDARNTVIHGNNVYGTTTSGITFDGTDDSITTGYMSTTTTPTIELNYHKIEWEDDFMSFECQRCEESFEVPEIFQASSGFRVALYQLYILGHFRNNKCPEEDKTQAEKLQDILDEQSGQDDTPLGGPPVNPNPTPGIGDTYWVDGGNSIWQVDTPRGDVTTNGSVIMDSTDPRYTVGDRLTEKQFMELHSQ